MFYYENKQSWQNYHSWDFLDVILARNMAFLMFI